MRKVLDDVAFDLEIWNFINDLKTVIDTYIYVLEHHDVLTKV